jgi:hypothetical protein
MSLFLLVQLFSLLIPSETKGDNGTQQPMQACKNGTSWPPMRTTLGGSPLPQVGSAAWLLPSPSWCRFHRRHPCETDGSHCKLLCIIDKLACAVTPTDFHNWSRPHVIWRNICIYIRQQLWLPGFSWIYCAFRFRTSDACDPFWS